MGNNVSVVVLGIGTCKLKLREGHTFYLYASKVRRNLVSVFVLLELGFRIVFDNGCVKIFLDNVYHGSRYLSNGFWCRTPSMYLLMMILLSMLLEIPMLVMIMIVSFGMLD